MQQPQFLRDEKSSPGELLAHCKSISTGSKVRLLFSILSSEQMMTCLDNHTITGQSLDLGECSWAVKLKGGERAEPAVPQHKARSPHTSDGWNPKAKGLCRQGNFKGSSYLLKSPAPLLQITIPLVTLMQLFVRLLSKKTANTSQFEQGLQKCIKTNSVIQFPTQAHKQQQ